LTKERLTEESVAGNKFIAYETIRSLLAFRVRSSGGPMRWTKGIGIEGICEVGRGGDDIGYKRGNKVVRADGVAVWMAYAGGATGKCHT
jgi:hypothetical protein